MSCKRVAVLFLSAMALFPSSVLGESLLVEAEGFDSHGGWSLDQQFMQTMGSPYLLAHGMGKPVADAETTVEFKSTGKYRMWVRTMDWVPGEWKSPGRFQVILDGVPVEKEFGTLAGWQWQDGGMVDIKKKSLQIKLHDLTGFEGRCDAIFFTNDPAVEAVNFDAADPEVNRKWRNKLRGLPDTPPDGGRFDVIVVGGGIAGCAAALAAEERGLRVALVHDREALGGNASIEVRVGTSGIYGKGGRILNKLRMACFTNSTAIVADQARRDHTLEAADGIRMFKPYRAYDVKTVDGKIVSIDALSTRTGKALRLRSDLFIDCTGDGWIGYWAGASYSYGRESRDKYDEVWPEYGNRWSPKKADNRVMGSTLLWTSKVMPEKSDFPEVPWAMDLIRNRPAGAGETLGLMRCSDKYEVTRTPPKLVALPYVTVGRGDYHKPAPPYSFVVDRDAAVYLVVDDRGDSRPGDGWRKTDMTLQWDGKYIDSVYVKQFTKGRVDVPGNVIEHIPDAYGLPHLCFVEPTDGEAGDLQITDLPKGMSALTAQVGRPRAVAVATPQESGELFWEYFSRVYVPSRWGRKELQGAWFWEYSDNDKHQIDDAERIRDHLLQAIYATFHDAKKNPKWAYHQLDWVGYVSGKRESRRLTGDYVYTMKDMVRGTRFDDAVVEETRMMDLHFQRKFTDSPYDFLSWPILRTVPRYCVPFRALYSKDVENLMMAGRCFSCSHIGLTGPRVMNTCGQMGIATGYAASLCIQHRTTPRGVYKDHIDELKKLISEVPEPELQTDVKIGVGGESRRTSDDNAKFDINEMPDELKGLSTVTISRGNMNQPAPGFTFKVSEDSDVYLAVHDRGGYTPPKDWEKSDMKLKWSPAETDTVYVRSFKQGEVVVPWHSGTLGSYYGAPNMAFVESGTVSKCRE